MKISGGDKIVDSRRPGMLKDSWLWDKSTALLAHGTLEREVNVFT